VVEGCQTVAVPLQDPAGLAAAIEGGPVLLDGGLATQLEAQGADLTDTLWSAGLLIRDPAAVVAAHEAFFAVGAEVATTVSYQASYEGLRRAGLDDPAIDALLTDSVTLARRAAENREQDRDHRRRWVAASVGPYGAMLADGSEYRGHYGLSVSRLRAFHHRRLQVLAAAEPDVLALETVPELAEVEALVAELDQVQRPAWLAMTVRTERALPANFSSSASSANAATSADADRPDQARVTLASGESFAAALAIAADSPWLIAVGVNCSRPEDATVAVATVAAQAGKPAVVYPNSGEIWDPVHRRWAGRRHLDPTTVSGWLSDGAVLVGGCCRIDPATLAELGQVVHAEDRTHRQERSR
jgi:homocysteine S-methyltransferase